MAMAHLSAAYGGPNSPNTQAVADGVCVGSAMLGAATGALAGVVAAAGSGFEYAPVLVGTLGVILGSILAATVGRCLIFPVWTALARATHRN